MVVNVTNQAVKMPVMAFFVVLQSVVVQIGPTDAW